MYKYKVPNLLLLTLTTEKELSNIKLLVTNKLTNDSFAFLGDSISYSNLHMILLLYIFFTSRLKQIIIHSVAVLRGGGGKKSRGLELPRFEVKTLHYFSSKF